MNVKDNCFIYPDIVGTFQVKDLYDSARWYIYTWHCDMSYTPKGSSSQKKTFGELELRFNNVIRKNDTVDIDFDFIDNGEPVISGTTLDHRELNAGIRFDYRSRKKLAMLSPNGYSIKLSGGINRYENPLEPKVVTYLKNNWSKLNDCFRELAKRHGISK